MRRLLILTLATLLVCVAVCTASQIVIDRLLTRAHDMNTEIHMAMEKGDETAARDGLVALATYWDEYRGILEVLCDHEDLHNVGEHIIEARICPAARTATFGPPGFCWRAKMIDTASCSVI